MEIKERIALRIHTLRAEKKLTQQQLARKSGIKKAVIALAESGDRHISIETLNKILNGLEISLRAFIGEEAFTNWMTESPWKEYFYINMHRFSYLYCDQPTTCPLCGARVDSVFEYDVLLRYATINQCYNKHCWHIFMMETDWDEMKYVISILRGKLPYYGSDFEDCI